MEIRVLAVDCGCLRSINTTEDNAISEKYDIVDFLKLYYVYHMMYIVLIMVILDIVFFQEVQKHKLYRVITMLNII